MVFTDLTKVRAVEVTGDMIFGEDIQGLKVVVRDVKSGATIADTIVRYYDKHFDVIRIESDSVNDEIYPRVQVLLFSSKGLFKCSGTVRGNGSTGEVDIALYNGNEEDDRKAVRYVLTMPGTISNIFRPGEGVIEASTAITVINMSTTGFLFQAPEGLVDKKDVVKINCLFKGKRISIQGEVVRIQHRDIQHAEYGCKLYSVKNV